MKATAWGTLFLFAGDYLQCPCQSNWDKFPSEMVAEMTRGGILMPAGKKSARVAGSVRLVAQGGIQDRVVTGKEVC